MEKVAKKTVRHGGYVHCGIRKRRIVEMYVEIDADVDVTDCGAGTDLLVETLRKAAVARGLRNVEVREVW